MLFMAIRCLHYIDSCLDTVVMIDSVVHGFVRGHHGTSPSELVWNYVYMLFGKPKAIK